MGAYAGSGHHLGHGHAQSTGRYVVHAVYQTVDDQ